MLLIPRRFRRPDAELRIDSTKQTPPDEHSGGVVCLRVSLIPRESFVVRRGWLELSLLATHFSRTVLDGYHEHTSKRTCTVVGLCEGTTVNPGATQTYFARVALPRELSTDSRPTRLEWQAKANLEIARFRDLCAVRLLHGVSPRQGGAPVVDGSGFLPLYEFRGEEKH